MFTFKKSIPLLMISIIMLFIISACSQANGASQQPEQNQEGTQVETNNLEPSNETSPSILPGSDQHEEEITFEPVVLFSLSDEDLNRDVTEIPYYNSGKINFVTEESIKSFNEGHSPWWSVPDIVAESYTRNLIPLGIPADQVKYNVVSEQDDITVVEMKVPDLGTFSITLKYGGQTSFSFITEIVWQPESSKVLQQFEGSITLLDLNENWFDKKTNEIPSFSKGNISFFEQENVDSFNQGHNVPWGDPLVQGMLKISELTPYDYLQDEAISHQLTDRKEILTTSNGIVFTPKYESFQDRPAVIQVEVPDFGTYTVTLNSGTDSAIAIVQKIVFQAHNH